MGGQSARWISKNITTPWNLSCLIWESLSHALKWIEYVFVHTFHHLESKDTHVSFLVFVFLFLTVIFQLIGYSEKPVNLQMFIGTADDRYLRPHAFYQVHRITGKTVATASQEIMLSSTKVLEIPLLPENNMSARYVSYQKPYEVHIIHEDITSLPPWW